MIFSAHGQVVEHLAADAIAPRFRVLFFAADQTVARRLRDGSSALRVELTVHARHALAMLSAARFDACILHVDSIGPADALAFLAEAGAASAAVPLILLDDRNDPAFERDAFDLGVSDVIEREDLDPRRIERVVRLAIHRKRTAERLDRLAQIDAVTGLGNRQFLQERLQHALAAARRARGFVAVMVMDLDGFKAVNDTLGHAAGDELLRAVGDRLRARLRETDTIARIGGDEFAVVLGSLPNADQAGTLARRLLDAMDPPFIVGDRPADIAASLGVAIFPNDAADPATLLRLADAAMYAAKTERGNACRFNDARLDSRNAFTPAAAEEVRAAIEDDQILLSFAPQLPLGSDRIGICTIPRWRHRERGLLDLGVLVTTAEAAGLTGLLLDHLVTTICSQARTWQKITSRPFHLTLPVPSRALLDRADLAVKLQDELQRHGLPRAAVEIEVPEQVVRREIEDGGMAFGQIKAFGIRLAIENFGGGHGDLRWLRDVPVRTLKLAPDLLDGVPEDADRTRFLRALLRLARELRLRVVATGAAGRGQIAALRAESCDAIMESWSDAPLSVEACAQWLADQPGRPAAAMPRRL